MNPSTHAAGLQVLEDAMSAPLVHASKHAGWKRDQYLRITEPVRLRFIGDVAQARLRSRRMRAS